MEWFKMKLIKICTIVILLICYITIKSPIKIYAFGVYTHCYIGSLTWQENNMSKQYEQENIKAYESGIMVADIGLLNWDKKYKIDSDSFEFKNKMVEIASRSNSKDTKLFALGWSDHVYHDKHGSVKKVISIDEGYRKSCLIIDKYIISQIGEITLKDLYIDCNLIRDTYKALCNFSPTDEQIKQELDLSLNMMKLMISQVDKNLTNLEKEKAETELLMVSKNCGNKNPDSTILHF
ncbi:MAG: hypothetical protein RUMPE_01097 [Eubacteriales bacterium SKADARSKE-1]|nr:hypothetical protein [Eubacteriales bacterium SKADARSKE-1]